MRNLTITINREYGSGGSAIGRLVAQRLGIMFYGRTELDAIAHERGIDRGYISSWQQNISSMTAWGNCGSDKKALEPPYYSDERQMFLTQSRLIEELAVAAPCVFVGCCADYVLKQQKGCFRVMIGADEDSRALRIYHDYKEHVADLTVGMRRVDHKRIAYYERYADTVWCDPQHYHLCFDSGVLGIEVCADMIVFAVQSLYNSGGICL